MNSQEDPQEITTGLVATQDLPENQVFIISDPGLEDIVKNELQTCLQRNGCSNPNILIKPFGLGGQLLIKTPKGFPLHATAVKLRSIHHALIPIHHFDLPDENAVAHIESEVGKLSLSLLNTAKSFRVTTQRTGKHDFKSTDVERRAGAALWRKYGTSVDLKNHEIDIHVNIFEHVCFVGIPLHKKPLSNRFRRQFQPRIALKASIAHALLALGKIEPTTKSAVLDPFCGSGTILFEAAHYSSKLALYGSDIDPHVVAGAQMNAEGMNLTNNIQFVQGDARELNTVFPLQRFDHIVTNPPYGLRFGQHLNFERFYVRILQQFWYRLTPDATVVFIALKWKKLSAALRLTGLYKTIGKQRVDMGDVKPHIVSLRRIQKENE
ncbi:MAG: THUMP domain-containing protein [Candidatus Latescibacterota bacterium]|nr:THUMP domain-containing protein [Candidatus Latescibacterota bacterium]